MRPQLLIHPVSDTADASSAPAQAPLHTVRSRLQASLARELWAGLHLSGFDPGGLEPLASRAQRFTPRVSLAPPDGLLLEVAGSLHLFGGLVGLERELTEECLRFQVRPVLAFAPTPLAALTAARAGRALHITEPAQLVSQLAPLPISALRWPEETRARLARAGVRTVGAVLRLPRAGFARRFGAAELAMLDALIGRTREVRLLHEPPVRFRRRQELDAELSDHEKLLAALTPSFDALGAFLTARQRAVAELECRFVHRHAPGTHCVLTLAAPCSDGKQLLALFAERLNAVQLPEPVRALELRADQLLPQRSPCRGLWQAGEQGGEAGAESEELIERLRARLGPDALQGLEARAEHRPECAWRATRPPPLSPRRPPAARAMPETPEEVAARPLWLLPQPQLLHSQAGLPRRRGALRLSSEPERIESGWWDGEEVARDYYSALDRYGVRLWVFRERATPHRWFLHGVFG